MPTPAPSAAHKHEGALSATPAVPARFQHCWDKHTKEFKVFIVKAEAHGRKFVLGKETTKEQLELLLSTPQTLRDAMARTPSDAINQQKLFAMSERLYANLYGPQTPASSQFAATFRLVGNHLKRDLEKDLGLVAAGWFNLTKHCEKGMPLRQESLDAVDNWLRVLGRIGALQEGVPSFLGERQHVASRKGDRAFDKTRRRAYEAKPDLRLEKGLLDLQLGPLRESLLRWWTNFPGFQPKVALCDFSYSAIGQFLAILYYGAEIDAFTWQKVRDAVRRLKLVRTKPERVTAVQFIKERDEVWIELDGRQVRWKRETLPESPTQGVGSPTPVFGS